MRNLVRSDESLWIKCSGSKLSSKPIGTHELTKRDVISLLDAYYSEGVDIITTQEVKGILVTEHLLQKVTSVLNFIRQQFSNTTQIVVNRLIEKNGLDIIQQLVVTSDRGVFAIVYSNDYKPAKDLVSNSELMLSLACELDNSPNIKSLYMVVVQPNCKEQYVIQPISVDQVKSAAKILVDKLKSYKEGLVLTPGNWCEDCELNNQCNIQSNNKQEAIMNYESLIIKVHGDIKAITADELGSILNMEALFIDAFSRAKAEAQSRNEQGIQTSGWHFQSGKSKSEWNKEPEEISKKLRAMKLKKDDIYPSKLMSPSQARKVEGLSDIQRKNLEKLITTNEGKPKLVKNDYVPPVVTTERKLIQF